MTLQAAIVLALKISIVLTVFGFGLRATLGDLLCLMRKPRLLVLSLVAMFVIMPLFAILLTRLFSFAPAVSIALIALSISPVPPLLPNRINKSVGIAPYGLGLMATAGSLSIVIIPLATSLIGRYFDRPFAMGPGAIAKLIVPCVLIPLAAGMLLNRFAPALAKRLAHPMVLVATILLVLGGLCILVVAMPGVWLLIGNGTILALAAFILVGLVVGHFLGGRDPDEHVPLALCTACRHPALAIAIAAANVPKEHHVLSAVLLYLILNIVLTLPYIKWQRKRAMLLASAQ